jgi:hypothetical protein
MLPKGAAAILVKEMLILCERVATSLVKRYANLPKGAAAPLRKTVLIEHPLCYFLVQIAAIHLLMGQWPTSAFSLYRAFGKLAASLLKRYGNFTQGFSRLSGKGNVYFI